MKKALAFVLLMLSAIVTPVVRGQQTAPQRFRGINPWADITAFGGRAVSPVPSTKASCNGSTTIAVESSSGFFVGDGITISGCGSTNRDRARHGSYRSAFRNHSGAWNGAWNANT